MHEKHDLRAIGDQEKGVERNKKYAATAQQAKRVIEMGFLSVI